MRLRDDQSVLLTIATVIGLVLLPAALRGEVKLSPANLYKLHCMGCHQADGSGSSIGLVPPIPGVTGHILKHAKGRLYLVNVPGVVNSGLPANEVAEVMNYVLTTWAKNDMPPDAAPFTTDEVERLRKVQIQDIAALRREIMADLSTQGIDIHYPQERP